MNIGALIEVKPNPNIPNIAPGDTVKVSTKIIESGKERIQIFQGVVIRIKRGGSGTNFTVRHVAYGIGVERTFPFYSPMVQKVEVVRHGKVRRARLYYLRGLSGKAARIKERRVGVKKEELLEAQGEPEAPAGQETAVSPEAVATQEAAVNQTEPPVSQTSPANPEKQEKTQ